MSIIIFSDELMHYGTPHSGATPHSGRYPWGSGKNPQRHKSILQRAGELKEAGFTASEVRAVMGTTDSEIAAAKARENKWGDADALHEQNKATLAKIKKLEEEGKTSTQIKEETGLSSGDVRALKSVVKKRQLQLDVTEARRLRDEEHLGPTEIARRMNTGESTIRNYLKDSYKEKVDRQDDIINVLKAEVDKKKYIDVGKGVELQLNITRDKLDKTVKELKQQGYTIHHLSVPQATNPVHKTSIQVLTKDDVPWKEVNANREKVATILDVYSDGGEIKKKAPPVSIDSSRIMIRYNEDGGVDKDGVLELRPSAKDLSMGGNRYSQVRVAVDDTHYLKGMAMYADEKDFPPGIDIIFNTNKHRGTPMIGEDADHEVLKRLKTDKVTGDVDVDNPFGAIVKQKTYVGDDGKEHQSPINIVNEDEDWEKWSKNLSAQFLSKQYLATAKKQLDLTYRDKVKEFEEIQALTNPVLKEKLMRSFADDCDSAAVHLKAKAFDRQASHVILPMPWNKPNEIYAPNYEQGEELALVRYPHGGTFEIAIVTVNNNNPKARRLIGNAAHAVGINPEVAQQLSGADFDGDTVVCIPTRGNKIKATKAIKELIDFEPKEKYPAYEGMPRVGPDTGFHKQAEMGRVTNLITDMTIKHATTEEIIKATKHSMVVIDAEKHNLDWRRSYEENQIEALKRKYQNTASNGRPGGSSTIISRAKSPYMAPEIDTNRPYKINPETGEKEFQFTNKTHNKRNKDGTYSDKEIPNTYKSTKMYWAKDAYELTSDGKGGTKMEQAYADYANSLKALGDRARLESVHIESIPYSKEARRVYKAEVESLQAKLNAAIAHSPKERKAQLVASKVIAAKKEANPDMTKEEEKKMRSIAIADARSHLIGTQSKPRITEITDREWEAIQSGAVTKSMLREIIDNSDQDMIRQRATPRTNSKTLTPAQRASIHAILTNPNNKVTQAELAKRYNVSVSTINKIARE